MRSLQPAIRGPHAPRFYRSEFELAIVIGFDAAKAQKPWRGGILPELLARIMACRVSLPNFQHRVRYYLSVTIEHFATYVHSLAGDAVANEIFAFQIDKSEVKE